MIEATTRDPDLTRARIFEAARELFVEYGFAAVNIRTIAEKSGVTKSLIHHHFGSKDQLWEEVKQRAFDTYAARQQEMLEAATDPDAELLRSSVVAYFHFLKDNPDVVRLFSWTHLERDESCGENDRDLVALGAERVRQAQEKGALRADVNPAHIVTLFINTCTMWFEAASHHGQWPGVGSDEEFLEDFLKVFMEGLLPRDTDEK